MLAVLLLGAAWVTFRVFDRLADLGPSLAANQLLLPALSLMLAVMVLALAGILIRNLVRLIVDRKKGILGARLRTKLVFFFLALVLLPAIVLFTGSAQMIKKTVEAILRTPLEDLTRQSGELVDQWRIYFEEQSLHDARILGEEIEQASLFAEGREQELSDTLKRWQRQQDLDVIRVTRDGAIVSEVRELHELAAPEQIRELDRLIDALVADVVREGRPLGRVAQLGTGLLAHAATPAHRDEPGGGSTIIVVGAVLPTRLAGNLEGFNAANQAYRRFRAQRKDLVRLYLTQIGLIFLVTIFIATWIGFYVARRITEPIQEMADAAREISVGNLDVRVTSQAGDELGTLVEAFNEMAAELQESRSVITRSTADLKRSNRELDERRRYIETLLENLSTGVVSLDLHGCVTTANSAVRSILDVEFQPGDDIRKALGLEGLDPVTELVGQALVEGAEVTHRDLTLERRGGPLHVAVQVSALRGGAGERVGTLVMVEDLTDLLRAQRAVAWREVAKRIAHEIKNPLTPIQLSAQRLRKKFAEGAPDLDRVLPEAMTAIEREVGTLKQLVDEFSRFARMPEIAPRPVRFGDTVDSVLALYEGLTGIRWDISIDEQIGEVVMDPEQMRRALINLVDNAVSALDGNGTIGIRARIASDDTLRIEITDSGPGIPPADRDKMFVPYFSTKKRGTGLGLAIVHRVITDHRGTITVEDNSPHGAKFVIEMPA